MLPCNLLVKKRDGTVYEGDCWPGRSSYVDFINPEARKFWADQFAFNKIYQSSHGECGRLWPRVGNRYWQVNSAGCNHFILLGLSGSFTAALSITFLVVAEYSLKAFLAFAETDDKLQHTLESEEEERIPDQMEKGQILISESEDSQARLEVEKQALKYGIVLQNNSSRTSIPEFVGKWWEWHNMWELLNATVNSTPWSDLQKFNYLLQALEGEARQSAKKYRITSKSYRLVVKHLQEKYGNTSVFITNVHEQMELCTA
ncbi:unnamed protein product [Haemonchus placei]|uniref:Integrase_H2C2 domain-containing protein n=1 Tax=Haemonchus placei TaxID=6290 RepID=A0A0N4WYT3_HAEPC|nr:unnamed protein product [Haemonchus placei]